MALITAEDVASTLLWILFRHYRPPRRIISDCGPQFVGHLWKQIYALMQVKCQLSTAFHPETNGAIERANQEMERYLYYYTTYFQDDWNSLLPLAMIAINNCTAILIGISPFFAIHGYYIDPININDNIDLYTSGSSPIAKAEAFVAQLKEASDIVQALIASAQEH